MADFTPSMDGPGADAPKMNIVNMAGAAVSLALIVGICVWGYQIVMRDVSGVPVVRALEGPMRVQPEDPGGARAEHQGLAVNSVAAVGTAEAPADRLVLAPRDVDLDQADLIAAAVAEAQQEAEQEAQEIAAIAASVDPAEAPAEDDAAAAILALANELAADAAPLGRVDPVAAPAPQAAAAPAPKPVLDAPGLRISLRPKTRPATLTLARAEPPRTAAAPALDVQPDAIAPGTALVQLGAFASGDIARAEWDKLAGRFGDFLEGKSRLVQKASSGGRTFYRLRAVGFADLSDARRFCSALVAENADCIPVSVR